MWDCRNAGKWGEIGTKKQQDCTDSNTRLIGGDYAYRKEQWKRTGISKTEQTMQKEGAGRLLWPGTTSSSSIAQGHPN